MSLNISNSAHSFVATAPSPATSGTTVTVQSGQGVRFPATPFNVTIWPVGQVADTYTNAEIATCTDVTGDVLTIVRAQEDTNARTVIAGDQIGQLLTRSLLESLRGYSSVKDYPYNAVGDGVNDDTAEIQAAIDGVASAGGGILYFPNGTYLISSSIALASNVSLIGETMRGVIFKLASSSSVYNALSGVGSASLSTTITGTVAKGDRTITLASISGYAIGDDIAIHVAEAAVQSDATNNNFHLQTRIMDIAGSVVTLLHPMPFAIGASDTETVAKNTCLTNIQIKNVSIDGALNTGVGTQGLYLDKVTYSSVENLFTMDFVEGSGYKGFNNFSCVFRNIYSENCAATTAHHAAFHAFGHTECTFDNISAIDSPAMGVQGEYCSYSQFSNLSGIRPAIRGVKFHGCLSCRAVNIQGINSLGGTGMAVSGGTSDCVFSNITTTGNKGPGASGNQVGVWVGDLTCTNNVFMNVFSRDNGDYDFTIFDTDTGNIVIGAHFSLPSKVLNEINAPMYNVKFDELAGHGMFDTNDNAAVGPVFRLHRHSATPAVADLAGAINFLANNSDLAATDYAAIYAVLRVVTAGSHSGEIHFSTFQGGSSADEMQVGGGVVVGNPTGGAKGIGTVNATAVYDDDSILTCYVLELANQGKLDHDFWDRIAKIQSRRLDPQLLDPKTYADYWKTQGHLPSLPSREEWLAHGKRPLGEIVQRLWETAELQAVHISKLMEKLES